MMVVAVGAAAVGGLAVGGPQRVQLAGLGQRLQGAVDRGQSDAVAPLAQLVVDLLRRTELVQLGQHLLHGGPLAGAALG